MNATTTSTTSTTSTNAKRVVKKATAAAAAPAPVVEPTPVVATATLEDTTTGTVDILPDASVASQTAAKKQPVSVNEEIAAAIKQLTAIRDGATEALAVFKRLSKAHTRELKDARKRKRAKKTDEEAAADGSQTATEGGGGNGRPCIFVTPTLIADSLCDFFGKPKGSRMMPVEVRRGINTYIDQNNLKANKNMIRPDAAMMKAIGIPTADLVEGDLIPRRMLEKYLYQLYIKDTAAAESSGKSA